MKTTVLRIALVLTLVQAASISFGQAGAAKPKPPKDKPKPPKNDPKPPQVPIDGGISVLLAAGIGLGAAKVLRKNKKAEE